jgi:hypothetical protein
MYCWSSTGVQEIQCREGERVAESETGGGELWFISGEIAGSAYLPVGLGCLHQVRAAAAAGLRIFLFEKMNRFLF